MSSTKQATDRFMVGFLVAAAGICVACITVYLALVDRGGML